VGLSPTLNPKAKAKAKAKATTRAKIKTEAKAGVLRFAQNDESPSAVAGFNLRLELV
jgi:hypothetical protein